MVEIRTNREQEQSFVQRIDWEADKVSVSLVIGDEEYEVWISANEDLFQETTDFLLPIALLPAMKAGGALDLPGQISPRLLSSVPQIQDIFNMWESAYKHIPVNVQTREVSAERGVGVACFFSGGVDSFHTALRHQEEISHLIYLYLPHEDHLVVESSVRKVRATAEDMGKPLIEVDTNLREFARQTRQNWKYYHGAWIAGVSLLLQHKFRKVIIAGSGTSNYRNMRPQGTHPILDPLWSTELTDFHHDGCEVIRPDKAAEIAEYEVAMRHLQICDATRGSHNCGHCKKCLRSMLNLRAAGALERCETLPDEIDLEAVRALDLSEYSENSMAQDNLRALKRHGAEPELIEALEEALERGKVKIAHSGYREEDLSSMREIVNRLRPKVQETRQKLQEARRELRETKQQRRDLKQSHRDLKQSYRRLSERNTHLVERNRRLTEQHSALRYRLVDVALQYVLKVPGTNRLLRKIRDKL